MPHVKRATKLFFILFQIVIFVSLLTSGNNHLISLCFAAYGLGSIPFGYLISRMYNYDLSKIGSGNIGATNVLRTGNIGMAISTLVMDSLKGFIGVWWLSHYAPTESATYLIALAAVLGHIFPIWLDFKGGKGVATGLGVVTALHWPIALISLIIWVSTAYWTRISSLAALIAWASTPILSLIFIDYKMAIFSTTLTAIVYFSHKENIYRLLIGREPKIGER